MNIIWITLESILPANSGGRLGVFKRLEQVSKSEKIFLFYPYDDETELVYADELKKYCVEVHPYKRKNIKQCINAIAKYPFTIASRDIDEMKYDILRCLEFNKIDIINVDFPHMCVDLIGLNTIMPIVLNEHNIEWKVYRNISKSQKNILKKIAYFIDSYRLKRYEEMVFQKLLINKVTFVSDKDLVYLQSIQKLSPAQVELIPVGADVHSMQSYKNLDGKNIIFVGKMSYGPNIEAVKWFVREIFPKIKVKIPDAKFYVVGKDPTDEVKELKSDDVVVTGLVDDISRYYDIADLVVLPLKNGGGVKVKLLEALSFKKEIVSTSIGVEGTIYSDGCTIPVCDDMESFTCECISRLIKPESSTIEEAYKIFINNYTWKSIGEKYTKMFKKIKNEWDNKNES